MAKADAGGSASMDRAELKRLLKFALQEPVQAAFALGSDGKPIVQLDKRKQPRALEKSIKDAAPDSKNHRFGTVMVDPDEPKVARFVVNKAASGMAKKLVIALKGTGFSKVRIVLEDGTDVDAAEGEDEEAEGAQDAADTAGAQDASQPEPAAPPEPSAGSDASASAPPSPHAGEQSSPEVDQPPDAGALTATLTALVKRMMQVIAADPSQKAALAGLATDAQASLKSGDLQQAAAGIKVLGRALDGAGTGAPASPGEQAGREAPVPAMPGQPSPPQSAVADVTDQNAGAASDAPPSAGPAPPSSADAPVIAKARQAWVATRQKIEGDIGKLHGAFTSALQGHSMEKDLTETFRARVDTVLNTLDEALAHKLDDVNKASDAAQRAKLVQDAHALIQRYQAHVASDPTIALLDENPFTQLAIQKTITTTLSALSKTIR